MIHSTLLIESPTTGEAGPAEPRVRARSIKQKRTTNSVRTQCGRGDVKSRLTLCVRLVKLSFWLLKGSLSNPHQKNRYSMRAFARLRSTLEVLLWHRIEIMLKGVAEGMQRSSIYPKRTHTNQTCQNGPVRRINARSLPPPIPRLRASPTLRTETLSSPNVALYPFVSISVPKQNTT